MRFAVGSIGIAPLDAALILWHHLIQVRRPGVVENCKILLLIIRIQAFPRELQDLHP